MSNFLRRSSALIAGELGFSTEQAEWRNRANKLAKLIIDTCYFSDEAMFYDDKTSGVKDPNMFSLYGQEYRFPRLRFAASLSNTSSIQMGSFVNCPFPAFPMTIQNMNPGDTGVAASGPVSFIGRRKRYGVPDTVKRQNLLPIACLEMMQKQSWLMEAFNSDPQQIGKDGFELSQPEHIWTQAAAIELLLERYKEAAPVP